MRPARAPTTTREGAHAPRALEGRGGLPGVGFKLEEKVVAADAALGGERGQGTQIAVGTPGREFGQAGAIFEIGGGAGDVGELKAARGQNDFDHFHGELDLPAQAARPQGLAARGDAGGAGKSSSPWKWSKSFWPRPLPW